MIQDPTLAAQVHGLLEYAAMALGAWLYRRSLRAAAVGLPVALDAQGAAPATGLLAPGRFAVLVGLLAGAALGNKLVFLAEQPQVLALWWAGQPAPLGQSLVGGLLGGLLGVELAKRLTRQTQSTGDALVVPLACGIVLGRLGCFLAGPQDGTWGLPTALPWGLDGGDGVPRHPAPLYEMLFVAGWAALLSWAGTRLAPGSGLRFKLFLAGYLLWRLLIETLKPVPVAYPLGGSGIQWVCALALLAYMPVVWRAWRAVQPLAAAPHA